MEIPAGLKPILIVISQLPEYRQLIIPTLSAFLKVHHTYSNENAPLTDDFISLNPCSNVSNKSLIFPLTAALFKIESARNTHKNGLYEYVDEKKYPFNYQV